MSLGCFGGGEAGFRSEEAEHGDGLQLPSRAAAVR